MAEIVEYQLIQRNDTAENWQKENPVLAVGEIGLVTGSPFHEYRIGTGKPWNETIPFYHWDGSKGKDGKPGVKGDSGVQLGQVALTHVIDGTPESEEKAAGALAVYTAIQESKKPKVEGKWISFGTSITYFNDHTGAFRKGYQTRVMDFIHFEQFENRGDNGSTILDLARKIDMEQGVPRADYYTIEHGINDWGQSTPVGTLDDFILRRGAKTFFGAYREVIEAIYAVNPIAKVILCTPRKAYGYGDYLPPRWYDSLNGIYLKDYADAVIEIGKFMSFPICDFFNESQANQNTLRKMSVDIALHPNDAGYADMAALLIATFKKVIFRMP